MKKYQLKLSIIGGNSYDLPRNTPIPRVGDTVYLKEIEKKVVISDITYCYSKGIFSRKRTLDFIVLFV